MPGVTTRVTSRRTSFFVSFGSSTWSQMATLYPLRISLRDIAFGGVVGHSAHGDGDAVHLLARGERDLEFAGGGDSVIEEELVEIPDAKKQQRGGVLFLDGGVLPHQRCGGFTHEGKIGVSKGRV